HCGQEYGDNRRRVGGERVRLVILLDFERPRPVRGPQPPSPPHRCGLIFRSPFHQSVPPSAFPISSQSGCSRTSAISAYIARASMVGGSSPISSRYAPPLGDPKQ